MSTICSALVLGLRLRDGGKDDLGARLDAKLLKWLSHVGQEAEVGVLDWLALGSNDTIGMINLKILNNFIVIHSQLGSLYIFLDL